MTEILENPHVKENNAREEARQEYERWDSEGGSIALEQINRELAKLDAKIIKEARKNFLASDEDAQN